MSDRKDDLVEVLEQIGVDVHRTHGDEINARCPVHFKVKGRESARYSWYMNADTGLWHCFTCGSRGNLSMLVSELTDDLDALWSIQSVLINKGIRRLTEEEATYDKHVDEHIDWMVYAQFSEPPELLLEMRQLDADIARRFGVRWDAENKGTTLPIVSPLGELRGWQIKKTGAVWNHPIGVARHDTFFGIERAFSTTALIVESPLDVVRFHSVYNGMDVNCLSSFGAAVSEAQIRLASVKFDKLIIALDNDAAGQYHTKRIQTMLPSFRKGVWYWRYNHDDPKDIGEMTDGQIIRGIDNITSVFV